MTPTPRAITVTVVRAFALLMLATAGARGQSAPTPDDHRATLEIGAATERGIGTSSSSVGGTVAVEFTPIEHWLEMETGITALQHELSVDLLFKKPWRLSATSEFMAGVGPELSHQSGGGTSLATEFIADWMFWPKRNVGWYVEPSYSFTAMSGGERNLGIAAGLLIGFP